LGRRKNRRTAISETVLGAGGLSAHLRFHILAHLLHLCAHHGFGAKWLSGDFGLRPEKGEDKKANHSNPCHNKKRNGHRKQEHKNSSNRGNSEKGCPSNCRKYAGSPALKSICLGHVSNVFI